MEERGTASLHASAQPLRSPAPSLRPHRPSAQRTHQGLFRKRLLHRDGLGVLSVEPREAKAWQETGLMGIASGPESDVWHVHASPAAKPSPTHLLERQP